MNNAFKKADDLPPKYSLFREFLHQFSQILATKGILISIGIIKGALIARFLGPEARGALGLAESARLMIVDTGSFGFVPANLHYSGKRPKIVPELIGNSILHGLAVGSGFGLIALIFFSIYPQLKPVDTSLFILAVLAAPLSIVLMLLRSLLLGVGATHLYNGLSIFAMMASLILILVCHFLNWLNPFTALLIETSIFGFSAIYIAWKLIRRGFRIKISLSTLKETYQYGFKSYLLQVIYTLTHSVDIFLINFFIGTVSAGYYATAAKGLEIVLIVPNVAFQLILPKISALKDPKDRITFCLKSAGLVGSILGLIAVVAIFALKSVIVVLYGAEFEPAYTPLAILLFSATFFAMTDILSTHLFSVGIPKLLLWLWGILFILKVGLIFIYIGNFGINAPPFAGLLCNITAFFIVMVYILRIYRSPQNR